MCRPCLSSLWSRLGDVLPPIPSLATAAAPAMGHRPPSPWLSTFLCSSPSRTPTYYWMLIGARPPGASTTIAQPLQQQQQSLRRFHVRPPSPPPKLSLSSPRPEANADSIRRFQQHGSLPRLHLLLHRPFAPVISKTISLMLSPRLPCLYRARRRGEDLAAV
ncbi:hypothetical protein FB45DRAFT_278797 [Roridomyces roridus]|uniref:Uncharacterized protein n=1 Tax=Roridomyces roridus TaxID=1738132 RepID=A0AAD7CAS3_9AGAR|nr:hypothetical protein FB45DRAFT_278797 [Roridomyces roridus]